MPLVALFYGGVMETGATPTLLVVLKQSVNGICNALVASLLLTHTSIRRLAGAGERQTVPLRQMVFELLVTAVLVPLLALVVSTTRQDLRKLEGDLLAQLDQTADSLASRIGTWRDRHLRAIVELANSAAERGLAPAALQPDVEMVHRMFPELATRLRRRRRRRGVEAVTPRTDAEGVAQAGISVADRPWLAAARDHRRPVVTSVFRGAARPPRAGGGDRRAGGARQRRRRLRGRRPRPQAAARAARALRAQPRRRG